MLNQFNIKKTSSYKTKIKNLTFLTQWVINQHLYAQNPKSKYFRMIFKCSSFLNP